MVDLKDNAKVVQQVGLKILQLKCHAQSVNQVLLQNWMARLYVLYVNRENTQMLPHQRNAQLVQQDISKEKKAKHSVFHAVLIISIQLKVQLLVEYVLQDGAQVHWEHPVNVKNVFLVAKEAFAMVRASNHNVKWEHIKTRMVKAHAINVKSEHFRIKKVKQCVFLASRVNIKLKGDHRYAIYVRLVLIRILMVLQHANNARLESTNLQLEKHIVFTGATVDQDMVDKKRIQETNMT